MSCKERSAVFDQWSNGMKTTQRSSDALIARNHPAVYSFASRLTDDPRDAIVLTRAAFNIARK